MIEELKGAPKKLSLQRRTKTIVSGTSASGKSKEVQVEVRKKRTIPTEAAQKAEEAAKLKARQEAEQKALEEKVQREKAVKEEAAEKAKQAQATKAQSAVNNQYVSEVIANPALPLAQGLWVTDAAVGNQKNAIAFSRAKQAFSLNNKAVHGVVTVAYANDQINEALTRLLDSKVKQILLNGDGAQIVAALNGAAIPEAAAPTASSEPVVAGGSVVGTFTIRNEHGLHARPSAILVNEVKKFTSKINVENLTRGSAPVSAKSLMKVVALGVVKGHRLRFVATGEQAQQAIDGIGAAINAGLGE